MYHDLKNYSTPRTMKDACEKYWQTSKPVNSAGEDAGECALWFIGALIIGAALGAMLAWRG